MMSFVMMLCTAVVGGVILNGLAVWLDSKFLSDFLKDNLILLLSALMAINTTTMSVVMSKLKEIQDKHVESDFSASLKEMRASIYEQIFLILIALVIQIIMGSGKAASWGDKVNFGLESGSAAIFIYAMIILYDTAKSTFVILGHDNKSK